jgi:hypothetical protein
MSQKNKGKWSHQDAFADENKAEAEIFASLMADKHARKMAEHTQCMVELEIKKQRIDLEANEKHLEAEDHQITVQHQREHEKEQHAMQMLCLHSIRVPRASLDMLPLHSLEWNHSQI